jgi:hypothetical protein
MKAGVGQPSTRHALHRCRGALYDGGPAPDAVVPTERPVTWRRAGRSGTDRCPDVPPWPGSTPEKEGLQP